jgi:hypothetical protein
MAKAYDRILELAVLADESDDFVSVTAVKFYRDRGFLEAADGYTPVFTAGAAAATHEMELGEVLPPFSIIRLVSTFQA